MITNNPAIKLLLSLSILLCVGGLIAAGAASAQEAQIAPFVPSTALSFSVDEAKTNNQESLLDNQIDEIQRAISLQEESTDDRIKELENLITVQRDTINELRVNLKSIAEKPLSNGTTFEVWSGILLACVAVLVTVLGVVVALLSFFGYRELIEKGTESASLVAAKQTKVEFDRFIAKGRLDNVIAESINKIVYRGFSSDSDEDETEDADNE